MSPLPCCFFGHINISLRDVIGQRKLIQMTGDCAENDWDFVFDFPTWLTSFDLDHQV
jgi:hypothetical protein